VDDAFNDPVGDGFDTTFASAVPRDTERITACARDTLADACLRHFMFAVAVPTTELDHGNRTRSRAPRGYKSIFERFDVGADRFRLPGVDDPRCIAATFCGDSN